MRDRHGRARPVDQNDVAAPVQPVRLARIEAERREGRGRCRALRLRARRRATAHGVASALVPERLQFLEDPDRGQPVALRLPRVLGRHPAEFVPPRPDVRLRLDAALVRELSRLPTAPPSATSSATPGTRGRSAWSASCPESAPDRSSRPFHHRRPESDSRSPRERDAAPVSAGALSDAGHPCTGSLFHAGSHPLRHLRRSRRTEGPNNSVCRMMPPPDPVERATRTGLGTGRSLGGVELSAGPQLRASILRRVS